MNATVNRHTLKSYPWRQLITDNIDCGQDAVCYVFPYQEIHSSVSIRGLRGSHAALVAE